VEIDIAFLIFLIFLSAVFSGGEVAFISISAAKIRNLLETKKKSAKIVHLLKKNPQRLLITILIGNNLVNIGATVIATAMTIKAFGNDFLGIVTGLLTFCILIFGEIIPKTFAQKYSIAICKMLAYPFLLLEWILFPLIIFLEIIIKLFLKIGGNEKIKSVTEEELLAMVSIGKEEGTIEKHEQEIIANILEFSDTQAEEVMTPRVDIKALSKDTTIEKAIKIFIKNNHTRIPVYNKNIDNIIGILTLQNAVKYYESRNKNIQIGNLELLEPIIIPHSKAIKNLFNEFKKRRIHMAIVVDEFGGVIGLVTMEDLLEEIVGEIEDEGDKIQHTIKKIDQKTFIVDGNTPLEVLMEALKVKFNKKYPEHKPISYVILEVLERFPKANEKINIPKMILTVEKMGKKRIEKVRITKI